MLCCIRTPWAPGLSTAEQLGRAWAISIDSFGTAQQADVSRWEGIHFTQGAQGDVLGCPFSDSADRAQPSDRLFNGSKGPEQIRIRDRRLRQCLQRRLTGQRHAEPNL